MSHSGACTSQPATSALRSVAQRGEPHHQPCNACAARAALAACTICDALPLSACFGSQQSCNTHALPVRTQLRQVRSAHWQPLAWSGDCRYKQKVGKTYYIGWRWRINMKAEKNAGITIFQWKSYGDFEQNYPFNMGYDGEQLSLTKFDANWQDDRKNRITQARTSTTDSRQLRSHCCIWLQA